MAGGDYTRLKGVDSFAGIDFEDQLVENLIAFFDWAFLCKDGFETVSRNYGQRGVLKPTSNPLVWESSKANWVWESLIGPVPDALSQPVAINGIYIDDTFSANDGTRYKINYNYGEVYFNSDTVPDTSSVVKLDYSYKRYNFYSADNEWFRQVIFDPLEENQLVEILEKNRVYLPAIIFEFVANSRLQPYQLGSGIDYHLFQDVIVHILADQFSDRNKAVYAFIKQLDKTIWLYDVGKIADADDFPLDLDGTPKQFAKQYPELVDTYPYAKAIFNSVISQEITKELALFRASVRMTMKINLF